VEEVEDLRPGRALDLGCGEGRNAVWLAQRGWRVTAVDFSEIALARARRLASSRSAAVEWVVADLRAYEPPAGAFDLVLYLYVHLPAPARRLVLRRAAAALAPGGALLVLGHDLANLTAGHGGPSDPAVLYTPAEIVTELPRLRIERAEQVARPVETEEGEAVAIDALVRAVAPSRERRPAAASTPLRPSGGGCAGTGDG
jgi:SAM-dependent methyltransferase